MMKKIFILTLLAAMIFSSVFAAKNVTGLPQELPEIGRVERYQIADNIFVGVNFNVDLLFIAAATGTYFTHKGYGNHAGFLDDALQEFFAPYVNLKSARELAEITRTITSNSSKKFNNSTVASVMVYNQVLARGKKYRLLDEPKEKVIKTLREFYRKTDGKRFFKQNLATYNRMLETYINGHSFNHVQRLQEFFGVNLDRDRFEIVLSPVMNGGQALELQNFDRSITYVNIMNPIGVNQANILNLLYHETAHNFLASVLKTNSSLIKQYSQYANLLGSDSKDSNAFGSAVNETLARVVSACMLESYHGKDLAYRLINNQLAGGWKNVDEIYFLTKNKYLAQRERYPDFGKFLPEILKYLEAKGNGKSIDLGPTEEIKIKPVVIIGDKSSYDLAQKYLSCVTRGMSEDYVGDVDVKLFEDSLVIVTCTTAQKVYFTGKYEALIGYNRQELLNGIEKGGNFTRVYRNGSRTTVVFGAPDMASLEQLMAQFDFKPYF